MSLRKKNYTPEDYHRFAFKKGWRHLRRDEQNVVKSELKKALNINTEMAFYSRMSGRTIPNVIEYEQIERIFNKYNVKQCWGL